ncbi:MAG: hypothetical protein ACLR6H_00060 [Roseburia sp.]
MIVTERGFFYMTKEEKVERFQEKNKQAQSRQIVCAGSSLMEMFPVEKFVKEEYPDLFDL